MLSSYLRNYHCSLLEIVDLLIQSKNVLSLYSLYYSIGIVRLYVDMPEKLKYLGHNSFQKAIYSEIREIVKNNEDSDISLLSDFLKRPDEFIELTNSIMKLKYFSSIWIEDIFLNMSEIYDPYVKNHENSPKNQESSLIQICLKNLHEYTKRIYPNKKYYRFVCDTSNSLLKRRKIPFFLDFISYCPNIESVSPMCTMIINRLAKKHDDFLISLIQPSISYNEKQYIKTLKFKNNNTKSLLLSM